MFSIKPIGYVRKVDESVSAVEVLPEFEEGLKGIEDRSHLTVLFWMHMLDERERQVLQVHPMGDRRKEKLGVFALRSPMRPNPIGVTRVKLESIDGHTLTVSGLDAFDGSPVIDIKAG